MSLRASITGSALYNTPICEAGAWFYDQVDSIFLTIVGNGALSWSQEGPEDFILRKKDMLQGLSCSSYMIKLHPGMHSSMNIGNYVLNHCYKIWSVAVLRPDFILRSPGPGPEMETPTLYPDIS